MTVSPPAAISREALTELAPSGRLRAAVAVGEAASAVWNIRDAATGELRGVAADLVRAMEPWLGIPVDVLPFKSSAAIIEAADSDAWDVGCTPVDAERKTKVDFGTDYYLGDSTYMIRAGVPAATLEEVDRPGVRIIGVEGTATLRAARASLKNVSAEGFAQLGEALDLISRGEADAVALSRESIFSLLPKFPGARVLDGWFLATGTAIAVPKNRPLALALVTQFVEVAKQDGTLRAIFDANNMAHVKVPPAGSQS